MIADVLSTEDAQLALATLDRLRLAGLEAFAIAGGTALAWHTAEATSATTRRPLHDLDLVVAGLDVIPSALGGSFLLWHVHPDALPGRMLVQALDPVTALRIDIFGAYGFTLARSAAVPFGPGHVRVVSRSDTVARLTALLLDLGLGEAVPPKHARDFAVLVPHVADPEAQPAWSDHRRPRDPLRFEEAREIVMELIVRRADLLVDVESPFERRPCSRCREHPAFKLADPGLIAAVDDLRSAKANPLVAPSVA